MMRLGVRAAQPCRVVRDAPVDGLRGLGVEVAAQHQRPALPALVHEAQQVLALLLAQRRQQSAVARLQMRRRHAHLAATLFDAQIHQQRHLTHSDL